MLGLLSFLLPTRGSGAEWQTGPGFRFREVQPDAPASPAHARTVGFTVIPAAPAGVVFTNPVPVRLMMENNNLMNGSGLAAGDFDGDGWCDLYFSALDGTNALYRNLGNWRFTNVTAQAGVGFPGMRSTGALFADADGDGDLDLLVATLGHGVRYAENLGNGQFRDRTTAAGLGGDTGSTTLAMGDLDGDGDLDLYVANYGVLSILRSGGRAELRRVGDQWVVTGPHAKRLRYVDGNLEEVGEPDGLYLNDGKGRFSLVPWGSEYFLDEQGKPRAEPWDFGLTVQIRDVNGDRAPDIYVCNDFQTVDRFWINDGRGRFRLVPRLALRKQSFSSMGVDFADLDRDGFLDFFVTEMMGRDPRVRMRQIVGAAPLIPEPGRLENRPEVARNTLFLNWGDHTYVEMAHYAGVEASDWSWQPIFLDVDLDGYEDLLVGNGMAFDVQDRDVLRYVQSLGRQAPEHSRTNLALYPPFITTNIAWRNRGDLTFEDVSAAWGFNAVRIAQGLVQADLDNDGDLDLALNGINGGAWLLRNDTVAPRVAIRLRGRSPNSRGVGGVIRVRGGPVPVQMQEILCGGHYLAGSETLRVFAAGSTTNELNLEIAWRSGANTTGLRVQPNAIYEIDEPALSASPPAATPADSSPDRPWFEDLSEGLGHTHRETFFTDYQRQPLLTRQFSQLGPGVAWFDLDGDGRDELFLGAAKGGALEVFRWQGTNRFARLPGIEGWSAPDDLTGLAGWVSATGKRSLLAGLSHYESKDPWVTGIAQVSVNPAGALTVLPLTPVPGTTALTGPLAVADFDGDGDLDLFVGGRLVPGAYPQPAASRLFRYEAAGLQLDEANTLALAGASLVSGAVWSDLDGDGLPELILATDWGPLRIYRNRTGRLEPWNVPVRLTGEGRTEDQGPRTTDHGLRTSNFELSTSNFQLRPSHFDLRPSTFGLTSSPTGRQSGADAAALTLDDLTGWWNGVTTGDFDGDGRLDIVASNWGLNTPWRASLEHPLRLYHGDLAGTGGHDLLETMYVPELGADAPLRGLNALSQAFPMLLGRFTTHRAFGDATAQDLLETLGVPASSVAASTLASVLFLNRGTHFVARALPAEAQFAPAFALNVADADGDGHEDLFLSQNFFALRPEVARLDGGRGLWLRGDGQGGFAAVPGQQSGIRVHGEQRGAGLADFDADGRVDLVVSQNGTATRVFRNVRARPGLRVRLVGPAGNPDGIGAVLRLGTGTAWGPARELHAGSGYWSQDSAVTVLARPPEADRIEIRWPGGRRTVVALPEDARELVVTAEGRVHGVGSRSS